MSSMRSNQLSYAFVNRFYAQSDIYRKDFASKFREKAPLRRNNIYPQKIPRASKWKRGALSVLLAFLYSSSNAPVYNW